MSNIEREQLNAIVGAWESLPGGRNYDMRTVETWLRDKMAVEINKARKILNREPPKC